MSSNEPSTPAGNQIRNLLFVMLSAIICALIISGLLLYKYGPSGGYLAQNTILSPDVTESLWYTDSNQRTGGNSRFVFDAVEFSYYDNKTNQWQHLQVDQNHYRTFYQMVMHDKSISDITPQLLSLFDGNASLILKVRTESNAGWQEEVKTLQRIEFAKDGDHYRVDLREQNSPNQWAYFAHPQIFNKTLQLFKPQ
jgi:hypothetical protein